MKASIGVIIAESPSRDGLYPFFVLPEGLSVVEEERYVATLLFGTQERSKKWGAIMQDPKDSIEVIDGRRCVRGEKASDLESLHAQWKSAEQELRINRENEMRGEVSPSGRKRVS